MIRIGTMSEPDWKRQSRIKENAWRWSARRLELEVVTDELEGDLTDEEKEMLDHVRKVVCKTLLRWGECLSSDVEPGDERMPTEARCHCQWEAGDSPCPTHGMDEEPAEDRGYKDDRAPFKVEVGAILRSPYRDNWRVVEIMSDNMVVLESDEGATIERPIDILRRWWSGV